VELPNRKTIEIRRKLEGLGNEIEWWKKRSEATGPLEKHAVLWCPAVNHQDAGTANEQALRRHVIGARATRVIAAAARLAFERELQKYAAGDAQGRLIDRVKTAQSGGVRGKPRWRDARETRRVEAADRETAQRLYTFVADDQDDGTPNNRAGS
jgi:hypothetical protein